MEIIVGIFITIIAAFLYFHFKGNPKFWRLTRKYPEEAYRFFYENDAWFVADGIHNPIGSKPPSGEWDGPFRIIVPGIGLIKIYGKAETSNESEKEFIKQIKSTYGIN